jgi:protocatechuate 3,4-dioxygenase beta subunit
MNTTTFLLGGCIKHRGLPIANVELTLMRAANRFAGTQALELVSILTPSSGEYRFTVEAGEYFLQVKPDQSTRFVSFRTESIFVNGNTKVDVLLELGRVWSGKFTSASTQIDDYGYELKLWNEQGGTTLTKDLQLGKSFELVLERTPYKATVTRHSDNGASLTIWTQNLAAQNDIKLDIILPDLFKLSGSVVDREGMPLRHARISILRTEHLKRITTDIPVPESMLISDAEGRFAGVLPEGYYVAMVEASGMASNLTLVKLHADTEIVVSMSAGFNANGQVLLKGMPVTALKLLVSGVNREFLLPASVDEQGRFDVWVPQGSYEFRIGGLEHTWKPPDAPQATAPSAETEENATVEVANQDDAATTTSSETSVTRILAPWVKLIDVANNIDGNIKLQDGYVIEFEVVDQNEHAIPNCIVDCRLYEAERDNGTPALPERSDSAPYGIISRVLTDATGRCQLITGAGVYTFDFIPTEESQAEYKQIRQLSINGNLRRKVRLTVAGIAQIITMDSTAKTPAGVGIE